MDGMYIKVEPSTLKSVSNEVLNNIKNVESAFTQMNNLVRNSGRYWDGKGHEAMKNAYEVRSDDYERLVVGVREHIKDLQTIAGVYETAESEATSMANELPGDVIF